MKTNNLKHTMEKTHFKKLLNPKYLGSHDLDPDKEYRVKIEMFERDVEIIGDGGKKQKKSIVHFAGASKPMILNATNLKMISVVTGSKYIEDWIGKEITIKVLQEKSFGEIMDVVRVLNKK